MPSEFIDEQAERDFHTGRHRLYRAAVAYVDASLRDEGRSPAKVRERYAGVYAAAVRRVFTILRQKESATLAATMSPIPDTSRPNDDGYPS